MERLAKGISLKTLMTLVVLALVQGAIWAQDVTTSTTTKSVKVTSESTGWYTSPLVWVVGAVVLILLLVALMSGRRNGTSAGRTDKVTVTRTTKND